MPVRLPRRHPILPVSLKTLIKLLMAGLMALLAFGWASLAPAQPVQGGPTHIAAALVAEGSTVQPGKPTTLALEMHPTQGWHGYWLNPGDAGLGLQLTWHLPAGASAGTPQYPVPETLVVSGLMNHVYQSDYALLIPFTVPADAKPGTTLPVSVKAEWLACTEQICVPESANLSTMLKVSAFPRRMTRASMHGAPSCPPRWALRRISRCRATRCGWASPSPPAPRWSAPMSSRRTSAPSTMPRLRASRVPATRWSSR
jgi:DsbC/DsbD-like thiol-disulfide interchange protein